MKSIRVRTARLGCLIAATAVACLPLGAAPRGRQAIKIDSRMGITAVPLGTPCTGLSYDTNNGSGGIAIGPAAGSHGVVLQRFSPSTAQFQINAVCAAVFANAAMAYEIVIYSDNAGEPDALLLTAPGATTTATTDPGAWATSTIGGIGPVSGPFWAGVRGAVDAFLGMPMEPSTGHSFRASASDGAPWVTVPNNAALIRVVGADPFPIGTNVPTLSVLGLAALVGALAVGGSLILRKT